MIYKQQAMESTKPLNKSQASVKKKAVKSKPRLLLQGPKTPSLAVASKEASKSLKELFRRLIQDDDGDEAGVCEPKSLHQTTDRMRDEGERVVKNLKSQHEEQKKTQEDKDVITQDLKLPEKASRKKSRDKNNSESQQRIRRLKNHLILGVNEVMKAVSRRTTSGVILTHPLEVHLQNSMHDLCRQNDIPCLSVPTFIQAISPLSSIGIAFKCLPVSGNSSSTPTLLLDCFREFISACQETHDGTSSQTDSLLDSPSSSCPASHVTLDPAVVTPSDTIKSGREINKKTKAASSCLLHFLTPSDEQLYVTENLSLESDKVVSGMKKIEDDSQEEEGVILLDKKDERHFFPHRVCIDAETSHFRVLLANSNEATAALSKEAFKNHSKNQSTKIKKKPPTKTTSITSGSGIGSLLDSNNSDKSVVKFRESQSVSLESSGKRCQKKMMKKQHQLKRKNAVVSKDKHVETTTKKNKKSK